MLLVNIDKVSEQIEAANATIVQGTRNLSKLYEDKVDAEAKLKKIDDAISVQVNEIEKAKIDMEATEKAKELVLKIAESYKEQDAHKRMEEVPE